MKKMKKGLMHMVLAVMFMFFINITPVEAATTALPEAQNGVITLTEDVELSSTYKVNDTLTIDLAGHTIYGESALNKNYELIHVGSKGNLTIKDSKGEGKISFKYTGESGNWGYYSNTISSNGILTVESGTIENITNVANHIYMAIDNNSNGVPAVLNIKGGKVECANYIAIRQFANTAKHVNDVNVSGGTITGGKRGIWTQSTNSNQNKASVNITGGTVSNVYITTNSSENMSLSISGNPHVGDIILSTSNVTVPAITITGGSFGIDVSTHVNEQYDVVKNNDIFIVCNHSKLTEVEAQPVDPCQSAGWDAHYECDNCNTWFEDEDATKVIAEEDKYIEPGTHKWTEHKAKEPTYTEKGNVLYYTCDNCKEIRIGSTSNEPAKDLTETEIPKLVNVEDNKVEVSEDLVDKAIEESKDKNTVVLPLETEIEGTVTSVKIPTTSIENIKESDKSLEIQTSKATVTIDSKTLETIVKNSANEENVIIKVEAIKEESLTNKQKEALEKKEVAMIISAEMIIGDKNISNFNGGKVTIRIPFTPEEGAEGKDYKIIYVADDGSIEEMITKYEDGALVAELEHFSEYVIVKDVVETNQNDEKVESDEKVENVEKDEKDETPKTGVVTISIFVWILVAGIAVVVIKNTNKSSKHSK